MAPVNKKKQSSRVRRNRFIALVIVIALVGAGYHFATNKKSGPRIPVNIVGESFSLAKKDLAAAGFTNIQRQNQVNSGRP